MRKFYWYLTAYIHKHGLVVVASVLGAIVLFSFLIPILVTNLEKNTRYYVGIVGEYTLETLPPVIKNQISVGLTSVEADGTVAPLLSDRWTIEHEGLTYRFVLKDDIFWQDGKRLEPSDIKYDLKDVETIITPNDIVYKLPGPFAPFPTIVSEPLLRPTTLVKYFFLKRPSYLGIGEYHITDYTLRGNRLTQLVIDGKTERYVYRFYLTEADAITAYKHGQVDILPDLAGVYDIMNWKNTLVEQKMQSDQYLAVFFNLRSPLFDKNVRQALNYALTKPGEAERAIGPINPQSWAYLEGGKGYEKDWNRGSERLLSEIPPQPLQLELVTTALFEKDAEAIKQEWESFGQKVYDDCLAKKDISDKTTCERVKIAVTVKITNFPDTSNFQVLLIGQQAPPDPDQYALWHSQQSTNFTGYKNTRIDNLLEKGRQTFDQKERKELYQEFQQFFLEDSPAVFLRHLRSYSIERS